MAKQSHHQPDGTRSVNSEIKLGTIKESVTTVGLLGGEAVSIVAKGLNVALEEMSTTKTENEVTPILVVGTGRPLNYEDALAVHKAIRSIGLGAARMPSTVSEG